mmetsp:Transcript_8614/g.24176  ORF Transcript_8614/g.24176 Transcript_8614/m.24176 type:complete len:200 (-) Transcript_8614:1062-1661(-)
MHQIVPDNDNRALLTGRLGALILLTVRGRVLIGQGPQRPPASTERLSHARHAPPWQQCALQVHQGCPCRERAWHLSLSQDSAVKRLRTWQKTLHGRSESLPAVLPRTFHEAVSALKAVAALEWRILQGRTADAGHSSVHAACATSDRWWCTWLPQATCSWQRLCGTGTLGTSSLRTSRRRRWKLPRTPFCLVLARSRLR